MTICNNCQYFLCEGDIWKKLKNNCWYDMFCMASPLPVKQDPVTGQMKPMGMNDFGQPYTSNNKYHYCRDINKGNCSKFKQKVFHLKIYLK